LILSYKDLIAAWNKKRIRFTPDIIPERQIGLSSIDLRLGTVFAKLKPREGLVVQPARGFDPTDHVEIEEAHGGFISGGPLFRLAPREFRRAFTLEEVTLPPDLAANVQGKSSLARAGLAVHITAPHIHPGFSGRITLEFYNHGPWMLEFVPGEDLVCQLILYKVTSPVDKRATDALSTYARQKTPFPSRERPGSQAKRKRRDR